MSELIFRPLAELCGRTITQVDPKKNPESDFWYVDISAVNNTKKRITSPQRTKGKNASVRAKQLIQKNDVLVATTRPNLNAVALVPELYDGEICSTGFCVLRANADLDPEYLFQFVQSAAFVTPLVDLTKGALYPAVTDKQVFNQCIPWLPVPEQRQIAARLKAQLAEVETARQAAQVQLRDAALLRQRLLWQTFDALGDGPHKVLSEWATITSGVTPARDRGDYWQPAEVPWVKTGEIDFAPITSVQESISKKALAECSLSLLPPKTVLVAITGEGKTRGRSAVLEVAATTNQHSVSILPNETWDAYFLQLWMQSSYHDLRELSEGRGGSRSALSGGQMKALEIPAPDIDDQRRIVACLKQQLAEAEALRAALEQQLCDLDALPQRILAQAFEN